LILGTKNKIRSIELRECDNMSDFFQLDRMNNQSCYNRTRKSNGEWSTRPFTRDRSLQICSYSRLDEFHEFIVNWDPSNNYFINLESLKNHLNSLESEYSSNSLQEYQSGSPQPVDLDTFDLLSQKLDDLINLYGSYPPILLKFRDGSYPYIDQGKDTTVGKISSKLWNIMLETCLPNISIPLIKKEMNDLGCYDFTIEFVINQKFIDEDNEESDKLKQHKRVISKSPIVKIMTGTLADLKFSKNMLKK
jgi:hypothetical protein